MLCFSSKKIHTHTKKTNTNLPLIDFDSFDLDLWVLFFWVFLIIPQNTPFGLIIMLFLTRAGVGLALVLGHNMGGTPAPTQSALTIFVGRGFGKKGNLFLSLCLLPMMLNTEQSS